MDTMALDTNRSTTGGAVRGGYARSRSWRARIRRREWFFGRPEAGKWVRSARLRTSVRRAIISLRNSGYANQRPLQGAAETFTKAMAAKA